MPICGDSVVDSGEACDDGGEVQTDACLEDVLLRAAVTGSFERTSLQTNLASSGAMTGT